VLRQHTPATPGQPHKQPLVIPLALALVGEDGHVLPHAGGSPVVLEAAETQLHYEGLPPGPTPPALSVLRGFSAPVRLELARPTAELLHLFACDSDPFARWDAGQTLLRQAVLARAAGRSDPELEGGLTAAFAAILSDHSLPAASRSALLALPGMAELEDLAPEPDPPALFAALLDLERVFGAALEEPLLDALAACRPQWEQPWPQGQGERRLTATIWSWRAAAGDETVREAAAAAVQGPSMTLARSGLRALQVHPCEQRRRAVEAFYQRWQEKPVILDAWFALEASAPFADGLERVSALLAHPRFDPAAPNAIRAVLGGFSANTPVFHAADGTGYRFMAEQIVALDRRNPITASRLAKLFSRWQSYAPARAARMREAVEQLAAADLSANTREVVEQCRSIGAGEGVAA
jgi:aminopeptidase N